jgi:HK97 family phage portal protein
MLTIKGGSIPLAPQALAELTPIIPQGYYYPDHLGMELEYRYALYGEIYMHSPWVHAVINKRAEAVARLPINVWDIKNNSRELDTRSAYARLMADPCEYLDAFTFWSWVQRTIDIYGETYLSIQRDGNGSPLYLMPMHPSRIAIRRNPDDGVYTYYFMAGHGINTELVSFKEEDVVPFKLFNPNKLERGMSKMEALRSTIFAEDSSRNATSSMWRNAGRPNIVLETENRLGTAGRKRLKLAFDQAHAGSSNAGQTLVLEDGVTAKAMQVSAIDMQYIESRQLNREEVCGVYDVAPPMVHILDRATFSNISAQMRAFYRDTMAPVLEFIQSVMDKYVGSYWLRPNIMRFAVDEVIRGDFEVRMEAAHKALTTGVMTPNEARELVGLNRYNDEKADKLYANSAIQELGEPGEIIRMNTQASGVTPDGIKLDPATTPIPSASQDGDKPNPPHSVPTSAATHRPSNSPTGPTPNNSDPSSRPKHLRALKGALGRGKDLEEFALYLAEKHPDELEDILEAVHAAIAEKDTTE